MVDIPLLRECPIAVIEESCNNKQKRCTSNKKKINKNARDISRFDNG